MKRAIGRLRGNDVRVPVAVAGGEIVDYESSLGGGAISALDAGIVMFGLDATVS